MAKEEQSATPEKKRRWYHNIADAYKVTARSYKWLGWALAGSSLLVLTLFILWGVFRGGLVWMIPIGIMMALMVAMIILSMLLRPAMYKQADGVPGSVNYVISQLKRGWITSDEPVAVNKSQDVVWRIIGRPGVVLISEGPTTRVMPMLQTESKRTTRVVHNVPVIFIQCGHGEGQVQLSKLPGKLRSLKNTLTKQEVPAVAARLNAVMTKAVPIPKGIDPMKARANRRALRGR